MPPSKDAKRQVAFRFPKDLLVRIEGFQAKLAAQVPGIDVTQANAVRVLLDRALVAEGFASAGPRARPRAGKR